MDAKTPSPQRVRASFARTRLSVRHRRIEVRAGAAYQVDQYHLRLLRLKGLAVDCPILHRSDRVVDGRGDQLFPHRQGATRALLAATGMGGGVAWIQMAKSKREALMLEAVKIAVEVG